MVKHTVIYRAQIRLEVETESEYLPVLDASATALLRAAFPEAGDVRTVWAEAEKRNAQSWEVNGLARLDIDEGLLEIVPGGLSDVDPEFP